jgi:hypothetical protein
MKRIISAFIFIICICSYSLGQNQTDDIDLLFKLMKKDSVIDLALKKVMSTQQLLPGNNEPLSNADSLILLQKLEPIRNLQDQLLLEEKELYKKHFTPDEIKDLIKFYQSPIGVKFMNESKLIESELFKITQEKHLREMVKVIMDFRYNGKN